MTETEYITIMNLAHITDALQAARNILPGFDGVVEEKELQDIRSKLSNMQMKLHKKVKIKHEDEIKI